MGLKILEIAIKIFTGVICMFILLVSLPICLVKTLIDGIWYADWHKDNWRELPKILCELWEHLKSPIFE
jgi:hypothetical protein